MIHSDQMITYSSGLIETENGEKAEKVVESYSEHAVAGSESSQDDHLAGERLLRLRVVCCAVGQLGVTEQQSRYLQLVVEFDRADMVVFRCWNSSWARVSLACLMFTSSFLLVRSSWAVTR